MIACRARRAAWRSPAWGSVGTPFTGGWAALGAALGDPRTRRGRLAPGALAGAMDGLDTRRLSRVCQLTVAAARLALRDAGGDGDAPLGVVVGTELGDLRSTRDFADGYRARGPAGLSALLFPGTVMNTMAAATSIALQARELSLTINAPGIPGELAVARAAASIAAGRAERLLAGGVDELDPYVVETLGTMGVEARGRGEGAAFLMLEALDAVRARERVVCWARSSASPPVRCPPARSGWVGRTRSRVVGTALAASRWPSAGRRVGVRVGERRRRSRRLGAIGAGGGAGAASAAARRAGTRVGPARRAGSPGRRGGGLDRSLRACLPAIASAHQVAAERAGVGLSRVSPGPGLVHGVARGGGQAAIVVGPAPAG